MRFSLVLIFLFALGCGGDDGPSDPGNGNNPPPPPPDPTLSSVTCTLDAIADVEYEGATRPSVAFAWSGHGVMSDATETVLDSAVVKVGGARVQKFTGGISGSGTLGSGDTADGDNTLSATCYRETRTGADTEGFGIFKIITATFEFFHFLSQEANTTGVESTLEAGGQTYPITFSNGAGTATVREGDYRFKMTDTDSGQLHRIQVGGDIAGGWRVIDRTNVGHTIPVTERTYGVETIDEELILDDMLQQWGIVGLAPIADTLRMVLYRSGNPTCPVFRPRDGIYCDVSNYPPGRPFTQDQTNSFYAFIDKIEQHVVNDPRIGWEAYVIAPVETDSISIQQELEGGMFFDPWNIDFAYPAEGRYVVIGADNTPKEGGIYRQTPTGLDYIFGAYSRIPGILAAGYAVEMKLFGRVLESGDPDVPESHTVCSCWDHDSHFQNGQNQVPGCTYNTLTDIISEKDEIHLTVVPAFFKVALVQPEPIMVQLEP